MNEQHIYNHYDTVEPKVAIKIEKNTKGFNYEVSVTNCKNVDEALALMNEARVKLGAELGS